MTASISISRDPGDYKVDGVTTSFQATDGEGPLVLLLDTVWWRYSGLIHHLEDPVPEAAYTELERLAAAGQVKQSGQGRIIDLRADEAEAWRDVHG